MSSKPKIHRWFVENRQITSATLILSQSDVVRIFQHFTAVDSRGARWSLSRKWEPVCSVKTHYVTLPIILTSHLSWVILFQIDWQMRYEETKCSIVQGRSTERIINRLKQARNRLTVRGSSITSWYNSELPGWEWMQYFQWCNIYPAIYVSMRTTLCYD